MIYPNGETLRGSWKRGQLVKEKLSAAPAP